MGVWAFECHVYHVLQMPEPLDVARVVPAEVVTLPLLDHERHGFYPVRVFERLEADLLCALDVAKHVPALECVTPGTYRPFGIHQYLPDRAVLGWNSVRITGHLGGFA